MGLFNKRKTAEDILKMIAELPEDERASVIAMLTNDTETPSEENPETASVDADDGEAAEESEAVAEGDAEATEDPNEEPSDTDPFAEGEETLPKEPVTEAAEDPAAEPDADPSDTPEPQETQAVDIAALLARLEKAEETIKALARRLDAADNDAPSEESGEDEDPFGLAFGAEHKSEDVEDELERAKREAGFNF